RRRPWRPRPPAPARPRSSRHRTPPPLRPISYAAGTASFRPPLAECLEAEDGAGHADVEGLGPTGHGDADGAVEEEAVGEAGGLVAEDEGGGEGPVDGGVVVAVTDDGAEAAEAGPAEGVEDVVRGPADGQRDVEEGPGRRPDGLRVVGVDGAAAADDGPGAGGVGGSQDGAGV